MSPDHASVSSAPCPPDRLSSKAGLDIEINANGSIRRMDGHAVMINLFVGNEVDGGPINIYLRRHTKCGITAVPLLGPFAPTSRLESEHPGEWQGEWAGLQLRVRLVLSVTAPVWFWHVNVQNPTAEEQRLDLVYVQDLGLSSYAAIRLNEYYVSHYVDHVPLQHANNGCVLAARQNRAVAGRHPWSLIGSLRRGESFATDALQVNGLTVRAGGLPDGIVNGLPGTRLQHEHALAAIQDSPLVLQANGRADLGFFGRLEADHPAATDIGDLAFVDVTLALPEAQPPAFACPGDYGGVVRTLFARAPELDALDLTDAELDALFAARRHTEYEGDKLLSFYCGDDRHVVLRAKELCVQRPHGHILRAGSRLTPDESALTSTVWMAGTFHSMVTQGHVSINRFLSTVRSWLGLFRSQGQRIFVEVDGEWRLLGMPSAFEIAPSACRWFFRHRGGMIEVLSRTGADPASMSLQVRVLAGGPVRLLVSHHVALGGDDGASSFPLVVRPEADGIFIGVPKGSPLADRFPDGGFALLPDTGSRFDTVGGDNLLFGDGISRNQPFVCVRSGPVTSFGLRIVGKLVAEETGCNDALAVPRLSVPGTSPLAGDILRLNDILPWYLHNALVHYLSPRGLEQYSGGGWGTRDICQGPLEMLLAFDRIEPVRDLLVRVFSAQNANGDWPQWFTFFERERTLRAGDSHGDIVYWPLLAIARYLLAGGDPGLLDEEIPFFTPLGAPAESGTLWQHVQRALAVINVRQIAGTHLAAYGHGDWNDSLQPADPALRDHLCSAWTVTLHHQVLRTLASALRATRYAAAACELHTEAAAVHADFQRLLLAGNVVTGYVLFKPGNAPQMLLHPSDERTGVQYSLLPMVHAILEDMLDPAQAHAHLLLIRRHLTGPDGARLFDRPMAYRGGPEQLFQRAESSAFFGREIGLMYTHAHLRYAEALAHVGDAAGLFDALRKSHPIGLRELVPTASLRQANCYFSSSDASFRDRYQASQEYDRVAAGSVVLDGGWRVYSSGPGIALGIVIGGLLGIRRDSSMLIFDPVMPPALDGLRACVSIDGVHTELQYEVGQRGFGPTKVILNGHALAFQRGRNIYRLGAAEVSIDEYQTRRNERGANHLTIRIG